MTERTGTPFSPALRSALQAVARMEGDSAIACTELLDEHDRDDRFAPVNGRAPQQGWKPAGR